MKKILILITLVFVLISCGEESEKKTENININKNEICENSYKVGEIDKTNLNLKGVVVSDDTKTVSSPIGGIVEYLNCNAGKKVYPKTLIAKITPDYNNPNISNLLIQKSSLLSQKANIESLKQTTISNLDNQIKDLKEQLNITKNNIELTKKSGDLSKKDLEKQISTLEDTTISLENNLNLLKQAKKDSLEKVEISRKTLYTNIKNISKDNLLKFDEIYGVTSKNKDLNDRYDDYLGTQNSILLQEVKTKFRNLNSKIIDKMNDKEISDFLGEVINFDENVQDSVKSSIENVYFPQTQIDSLYTMFLNYTKSLTELKNSWDAIENSKNSTITNFDSQISSLEIQLTSNTNNLENLQNNKILSIDTGNKLQLSQFESQLKTLNSNLSNLESSKKSQIINFDNQILQLNQSIASLNSSLSIRKIYANIDGIIKQKISSIGNTIGAGMSLCQIIPNLKSTKIKIYSPVELSIGDKLTFNIKDELYEVIIENALVYKDAMTQNYVYESNYLDRKYFKDGEIITLKLEIQNNKEIAENESEKEEVNLNIPVSYIKNKIDGNYIKILSGSLLVDKKVELLDINGNMVEIESGIEDIVKICK